MLRERGLGRSPVCATIDAARAFGLKRVELTVHADNVRAIRLYERVGFRLEGTLRQSVFIDGNYKNLHMMAIIDLDRWTAPATKTRA